MKVQPRRDAHFALRLLPLRALGGQDEAYGEAGLLGGAHYFHVAIAFILRLFSTLKRNDHDRLPDCHRRWLPEMPGIQNLSAQERTRRSAGCRRAGRQEQ